MPMVAATSGTLSMTADANPMTAAMTFTLPIASLRVCARSFSSPEDSRAPTLRRTPKKKRMPEVSNLPRADGTFRVSRDSPAWMTSVSTHMTPNPPSIPRYGGRPVSSLNTGTNSKQRMPVANTMLPRGASSSSAAKDAVIALAAQISTSHSSSSCTWGRSSAVETTMLARLGRNKLVTMGSVLKFSLIQSMVVVTSPIGVHTPPALAATTTSAPNSFLSSLSGTSFRSRDTMTMVTVRLFKMAERKKVKTEMLMKSCFLLSVSRSFVTTRNPW
mmetsp:Transcript_48054/g.82006  ORF Transcript_48054/g.82006 Transcript_48054/m.82006 type:complete len:274 (-) Transcript_48054:409-1230(-)